MELPLELGLTKGMVALHSRDPNIPFFCSWPDAFGPCQFEFNSSDTDDFMVPASKLASPFGNGPAQVRIYLTGFSRKALNDFQKTVCHDRMLLRCSVPAALEDTPELLGRLGQAGRMYTTLSEFQTSRALKNGHDAATIVGLVGCNGEVKLEVRFNLLPMNRSMIDEWLNECLGTPMVYAPLSPFP